MNDGCEVTNLISRQLINILQKKKKKGSKASRASRVVKYECSSHTSHTSNILTEKRRVSPCRTNDLYEVITL